MAHKKKMLLFQIIMSNICCVKLCIISVKHFDKDEFCETTIMYFVRNIFRS